MESDHRNEHSRWEARVPRCHPAGPSAAIRLARRVECFRRISDHERSSVAEKWPSARVTTLSNLPLSFFSGFSVRSIFSSHIFNISARMMGHPPHSQTHHKQRNCVPTSCPLLGGALADTEQHTKRERFLLSPHFGTNQRKMKSVVPKKVGPIYPIYLERDYLGVPLLHALFPPRAAVVLPRRVGSTLELHRTAASAAELEIRDQGRCADSLRVLWALGGRKAAAASKHAQGLGEWRPSFSGQPSSRGQQLFQGQLLSMLLPSAPSTADCALGREPRHRKQSSSKYPFLADGTPHQHSTHRLQRGKSKHTAGE